MHSDFCIRILYVFSIHAFFIFYNQNHPYESKVKLKESYIEICSGADFCFRIVWQDLNPTCLGLVSQVFCESEKFLTFSGTEQAQLQNPSPVS